MDDFVPLQVTWNANRMSLLVKVWDALLAVNLACPAAPNPYRCVRPHSNYRCYFDRSIPDVVMVTPVMAAAKDSVHVQDYCLAVGRHAVIDAVMLGDEDGHQAQD